MEQDINEAVSVLLKNGIIDAIEAEQNPNYFP